MACARAHEEWSTELWPFTRTVRGVRAIRRDSHALPSPHAPTRQLRISALLMLSLPGFCSRPLTHPSPPALSLFLPLLPLCMCVRVNEFVYLSARTGGKVKANRGRTQGLEGKRGDPVQR